MSETILSAIDSSQSTIDDKINANFAALEAKIVSTSKDMAGIRADISGIRRDLQSMNGKLDNILHIVKWVLPHS